MTFSRVKHLQNGHQERNLLFNGTIPGNEKTDEKRPEKSKPRKQFFHEMTAITKPIATDAFKDCHIYVIRRKFKLKPHTSVCSNKQHVWRSVLPID